MIDKKMPSIDGVALKKKYGQYFLQDRKVIFDMISNVEIKNKSVFEIGCGDGFLTRDIISQDIKQLVVFEIDEDWAEKVRLDYPSDKLKMVCDDFLETDLSLFKNDGPWVLLANLPYHITIPILRRLHENKDYISEGVIMVQEEVAQKIVKKRASGYGYISLFYQYYFDWKLLTKIPPTSFIPEPKIFSRLMHFQTKLNVKPIFKEEGFWKFIGLCFKQPRRTLKNNLQSTTIIDHIPEEMKMLRAQQLSIDQLLEIWNRINNI